MTASLSSKRYEVDDLDEAALAVSRVGSLDRAAISTATRERFSVDRMVDAYEAVYRRLVEPPRSAVEATAEAPSAGGLRTTREPTAEAEDLVAAGSR